jgi:hypothetical protein
MAPLTFSSPSAYSPADCWTHCGGNEQLPRIDSAAAKPQRLPRHILVATELVQGRLELPPPIADEPAYGNSGAPSAKR